MKKKLTFFSLGGDVFLRDIILNLRKDYDVKFFYKGSDMEFKQMLHDSDIAWFEFCDKLVVEATKSPKLCKYIVRLHSYEMFTDIPNYVDWNKIDKLVFVNDIVHDYCLKKFKNIPSVPADITEVIKNGVNVDKFTIPSNKKFNKKIAFIGFMNYKKGPQMLLEVFRKIYEYDNEYTFHIAGGHQDERIYLYFEQMQKQLPMKIYWDGWQEDIPKYLKNKDFVISSSLFESFQYSLAEGMSQGCIPLVHNWLGADLLYPKEYIYNTPEEAVGIVKKFADNDNKDKIYKSVREYIIDNFSLDSQINNIKKMLENL